MPCSLCHDVGWLLDSNGAGMNPPKSLELIHCIHPECTASGAELASLVFKEPVFHHVHANQGFIMSVTA